MFSPIEAQNLAYGLTLFVIYGTTGFLLLLIVGYVRNLRSLGTLEKQAKAASAHDIRWQEGPAIVSGTVEYAQGHDVAAKLEISQSGSESKDSSGDWSFSWTETDRRLTVAPFYLRVSQHQRLRIEPTKRVFLVDDLDGHIIVNHASRQIIAELVPGEEIIAKGMLRWFTTNATMCSSASGHLFTGALPSC